MLVEVRPIPFNNKWHGVTDGENQFTMPKVYEVYYNEKTGKYDSGLTEDEKKKFEKELGIDLSDVFIPDQPHPFFGTRMGKLIMENNTMVFDTEKTMEALKVKMMKACPFIANSLKEWEDGQYPEATHYIYDEMEQVEEKASKVQQRTKCIIILDKMTLEERINMAKILTGQSLKSNSADFIDVTLSEEIEKQPNEFLRYARMDKKDLYIRATLLEALSRNILTKEGMAIYYLGERIAGDLEEAIVWFNDPQNHQFKVKLLEKLA